MEQKKYKNWQSCFKANGLDPKVLPDVSMLPVEDRKPVVAQYIIQKVVKILNGDWVVDYTNKNQYKYYPWFVVRADKKRPSGFGLSCDGYDYWCTYTVSGVRLAYKDYDTMKTGIELLKKQYEDLYLPFNK